MSYKAFYEHAFPNLLRQVRTIKRNSRSGNQKRRQNPAPMFYAVAVGRTTGIYRCWPSTKVQIDGIANARYRRFDNHRAALEFVKAGEGEDPQPLQDYTLPAGAGADGSGEGLKQDIVYVDGSCWRNGMPNACAGIGVYWPTHPEDNISTPMPPTGKQSNIRAELHAAITALEAAAERGVQLLTIATDSHFVIQCALDWIPKWRRNGWRTSAGAPVKNIDDLLALERAIGRLQKVIWRHVEGHRGIVGNVQADRLANAAIARLLAVEKMKKLGD